MNCTTVFFIILFSISAYTYADESNFTYSYLFSQNPLPTLEKLLAENQVRLAEFLLVHAPQQVKDTIFCLQHPELFDYIEFPTRLLLVGPPGVGKTTLATAIAYTCGRQYVIIKCSLIGDKYQNSGPEHLKNQIEPLLRNNEPCVIVVDEIDLLAEKFHDQHSTEKKTVSAFWQYLDTVQGNKNVLFIGTTNDLSSMPAPLQDRFAGNIVEMKVPGMQIKKDIISFYLQGMQYDPTIEPLLLKEVTQLSGRNIQQLIMRTKRKAIIRTQDPDPYITMQDLQAALDDFTYTQSWRLWVNTHYKQIEKNAPNLVSWTLTAIGLYLTYCHYERVPLYR